MRSLFIKYLILLSVISVLASASTDFPIVKQAATNFLEYHGKQTSHQLGSFHQVNDNDAMLGIQFLIPDGYLVLSLDKQIVPVVAYSWNSEFGLIDAKANPFLNFIVEDIKARREYLDDYPEAKFRAQLAWISLINNSNTADVPRFEQWPPIGTTATEGWVETTWSQSAPYNNLCPLDIANGGRSLAGCPSVAMAQIMNYHRQIHNTLFDDSDDYYHNYGGNQYTIDDDFEEFGFPSFTELNLYLTEISDVYMQTGSLTSTQKAALVFAGGVAAEQVYGAAASGTFGVDQAYQAFQRFDYEESILIYPEEDDLYERIISNIQNGYPVHFASVTPTWSSGHNFVVDGYNTDGYYHLNFGWGGPYDGWYQLPDEIPYSLTVVEGVIVDLIPAQVLMLGDMNIDEIVNVQDIIIFVNIVMGLEPTDDQQYCGDLNQDGNLDVLDIIGIVNIILGLY